MAEGVRLFPRDRIQRLMDKHNYPGIVPDIIVEGPFIQLGADGLPTRQVFLAVTRKEVIVVKQQCSRRPVFKPDDIQIDISDLELDHVLPLDALKFFILDDRARRFTICTCFDQVYYFEMCQLNLDTDQAWDQWRKVIIEVGGNRGNEFGFKSWQTSYVINVCRNRFSDFEIARSKFGRPKTRSFYYIHHPHAFCQVKSRGVQTEMESSEHYRQHQKFVKNVNKQLFSEPAREKLPSNKVVTDDPIQPHSTETRQYIEHRKRVKDTTQRLFHDHKASNESEKGYSVTPESDTESIATEDFDTEEANSDIDEDIDEHVDASPLVSRYSYYMVTRQSILSGEHKQYERQQSLRLETIGSPKISRSLSEIDCGSRADFPVQESNPKRIAFARKILEIDPPTVSGGPAPWVDFLTSDGVQPFVNDAKSLTTPGNRSGKELWETVKTIVLPPTFVRAMERRFHDTVDHTLLQRKRSMSQTLMDLHPADVSLHLASLSRKLVLAVTVSDLQIYINSHGRHVPDRISSIKQFENDVMKMVTAELLRNYHLDITDTIDFFVKVSTELLFRHRDFQSLVAVLKGLTSLPIYRLGGMWTSFYADHILSVTRLVAMLPFVIPGKSFASYSNRVLHCIKTRSPFIPWIDHILAHCRAKMAFYKTPVCAEAVNATEPDFVQVPEQIHQKESSIKSILIRDERKKPKHSSFLKSMLRDRFGRRKFVRFSIHKKESTDTKHSLPSEVIKHQAKTRISKDMLNSITHEENSPTSNTTKSIGPNLGDKPTAVSPVEISDGSGMCRLDDTMTTYGEKTDASEKHYREKTDASEEIGRDNLDDLPVKSGDEDIEQPHMDTIKSTVADDETQEPDSTNSKDGLSRTSSNRKVYRGKVGFGRLPTDELEKEHEEDATNIDVDSQTEVEHCTETEETPDTKTNTEQTDKEKVADIATDTVEKKSSKKKKFLKFPFKKHKVKRERDLQTDHINVLQQDIADIEDIIEDVTLYPEYANQEGTNGGADINKERLLEALYGPVDKEDGDINQDQSNEKTLPYRPESILGQRRPSLLEAAMDKHATEAEEDEVFESLKSTKMEEYKKKELIDLDLLEDRADSNPGKAFGKKGSKSSVGGSFVKSLTRFFDTNHDENNNSQNVKRVRYTKEPSPTFPVTSKDYLSVLEIDKTTCHYCGFGACIYRDNSYIQFLVDFQESMRRMEFHTNERVRSCFEGILAINSRLSDFDLLQMSLACE